MVKKFVIAVVLHLCLNQAWPDNSQQPRYAQNLQQYIPTEIIDLPDDTASAPGQQPFEWFPSIPNSENVQVDARKARTSGPSQIQIPITKDGLNSFPSGNQEIVRQVLDVSPNIQQYKQYYNQPYFYSPFYPSQYVQYHYPLLFKQFPNGFYVFPDSAKISVTQQPLPLPNVKEVPETGTTERNQFNIQKSFKSNGNGIASPTNIRTFNHTRIGEKKTFVSHVELKPVSTKFTRYNKPGGKTYVKIISTDQDGMQQVREHEYKGNIDLKINNGILETPGSKNKPKGNEEVPENQSQGDPNSITIERKEEEEPETGEPVDVDSWMN
ncbi:hypothetical protein Trydic_g9689 [Trypoxylus dichotomus]